MSKNKIEATHPVDTSKEEDEIESESDYESDYEDEKETGGSLKEEESTPRTFITSNNSIYTEKMLLDRIEQTGLLDDYIGGREITSRSARWVECFSKEDLMGIFTTFPNVYDRCNALMSKTLGPAVKSVPLFHDTFCSLLENVLKKAKKIHFQGHWGFGEGTPKFAEFEFAISLLYTFLEEDSQVATTKEPSLSEALDKFAESDFVHLEKIGDTSIHSQLYQISQVGRCSAGFSEQLSRIYTAITLARAVLFYGHGLQKQRSANTGEHNDSQLWDYRQAAVFFKMKPELQKEMESPLYHGNINTETAKRTLRNRGDYLARYSSQQKEHYFTILLDTNTRYGKVVLNLIIPKDKLDPWIKKPMEHREEIEHFIKEQLSMQEPGNLRPFLAKFFENEHYSPVFNPVCSADIVNASPRAG